MRQPEQRATQQVATTRVSSGGLSARLVVVTLSIVLVALVWVGISGRQPPVQLAQSAVPDGAMTALGRDKFAVTAVIAQRHFMGLLEEKSPGELSGTYRLPFAAPTTVARFSLNQLWTTGGGENYVPIDEWDVPLDQMSPSADRSVLLRVAVAGRPDEDSAPRPIRLGYSLVISAENAHTFDFVTIDLKMPTG